ncbi:MAG: MerR family transcriptional regulator [Deltaproteobacteria bacterium]|nr:MerR family transcriptional regulator [Deltaproteobacteria bacterium]
MSDAGSPEIPDKMLFKIGEVSELLGVKAHVLRYWETEFRALRPQKTNSNQRLYRREDVQLLQLIKRLLYDEGYTIAGANRRIREIQAERRAHGASDEDVVEALGRLHDQALELIGLVEEDENIDPR